MNITTLHKATGSGPGLFRGDGNEVGKNSFWRSYPVHAGGYVFRPKPWRILSGVGRVLSVAPHMVQTQQPVCHMVETQVPRQQQARAERGYMGGAAGGTAGALLGSQVGGGNGNKAAIAVAAVTGAITGDRMQNGGDPNRGIMGAAIGGTAGALLGNQVGGGNGNKAAIALAAVMGAAVGDHMQNGQQQQSQEPAMETRLQQVCEQRSTSAQQGFDVTYSYNGANRSSWMQYDPGRAVTLDINVR